MGLPLSERGERPDLLRALLVPLRVAIFLLARALVLLVVVPGPDRVPFAGKDHRRLRLVGGVERAVWLMVQTIDPTDGAADDAMTAAMAAVVLGCNDQLLWIDRDRDRLLTAKFAAEWGSDKRIAVAHGWPPSWLPAATGRRDGRRSYR